jgi:hypothetical protein
LSKRYCLNLKSIINEKNFTMKKILFLGIILTVILSVSASAQSVDGGRIRHHREVMAYRHGGWNRFERRGFRRHEFRHFTARREFRGRAFARHERRHLAMMRMRDHRFYNRHRLI